MVKKSKLKKKEIIIVTSIIGIILLFILLNSQVSYKAKVIYEEQESYIDYKTETYKQVVDQKDCDYQTSCGCIKKGLFSSLVGDYCIRCSCERTRTVPVTKYRIVQKEKFVTKYCPALEKIFDLCQKEFIETLPKVVA